MLGVKMAEPATANGSAHGSLGRQVIDAELLPIEVSRRLFIFSQRS
jgi:hypothetical protein